MCFGVFDISNGQDFFSNLLFQEYPFENILGKIVAVVFITVTSHEHHGVSNHWHLNCLFKAWFPAVREFGKRPGNTKKCFPALEKSRNLINLPKTREKSVNFIPGHGILQVLNTPIHRLFQPRAPGHVWRPMSLSPTHGKGLWNSLSPSRTQHFQTWDESPSVIGQLRRFGVTGHAV